MIIGENGAITPEQGAAIEAQRATEREKARLDAKEIDRLKGLKNYALVREVRTAVRTTGKTNYLAFAYGLGLLALLDIHYTQHFLTEGTNDPYRLRHPKPAKKTRKRNGVSAKPAGGQ